MRVLVTGANGQLGSDVVNELKKRRHTAIGTDISDMDITDASAVGTYISGADVDAVIHCAAYTAVDAAEDNKELCRKINVNGTESIAKTCKALGIKLMYISTDYVFDGVGTQPWNPDDPVSQPLNIYGQCKYYGECAVRANVASFFIVRTSWAFGNNGKNFINTMLRLGKEKNAVRVVNDQIGSPTYTYDLARLLVDMIETEKYGIYHATNEGVCSWYEFACEIFRVAGINVKVTPVSSDEYPTKAKRPYNSRLNKDKLDAYGFNRLPSWQDATERYIKGLGAQR